MLGKSKITWYSVFPFLRKPPFLLFFPFSALSCPQCLVCTTYSFLFFHLLLYIFNSSQLLPFYTSTSCSQAAQSSPQLCGRGRLCPHQAHQSAICPWDRYRDRVTCFTLPDASSCLSIYTLVTIPLLVFLPLSLLSLSSFFPVSWQSEWRPPKSQAPLAQPALSPKLLHLTANDSGQPTVLQKKQRIEMPCNTALPLTQLKLDTPLTVGMSWSDHMIGNRGQSRGFRLDRNWTLYPKPDFILFFTSEHSIWQNADVCRGAI